MHRQAVPRMLTKKPGDEVVRFPEPLEAMEREALGVDRRDNV
jgi:hypothetical protein